MRPWHALAVYLRPPDPRPVAEVEADIREEIEAHLALRTDDNLRQGMTPRAARADALARFGDPARVARTCRRILVGDRIMLQRLQTVLTLILLVAVAGMAWTMYGWQQANRAALERVTAALDRLAEQESHQAASAAADSAPARDGAPAVVRTEPATGATNVDPALTELRATFSKSMTDGSWSWCQVSAESFPAVAGPIRYLDDRRTCVLPVRLEPGRRYVVWLNSGQFRNFIDLDGRPAEPYLLTFQTRK